MLSKKINLIIKHFKKKLLLKKIGFNKNNQVNFTLDKKMLIKQESEVLKEVEKAKTRLKNLEQELKNINVKE